jgi:hypothetical protein
MGLQGPHRRDFVLRHEAAIADGVGAQNGGEPANDGVGVHRAAWRSSEHQREAIAAVASRGRRHAGIAPACPTFGGSAHRPVVASRATELCSSGRMYRQVLTLTRRQRGPRGSASTLLMRSSYPGAPRAVHATRGSTARASFLALVAEIDCCPSLTRDRGPRLECATFLSCVPGYDAPPPEEAEVVLDQRSQVARGGLLLSQSLSHARGALHGATGGGLTGVEPVGVNQPSPDAEDHQEHQDGSADHGDKLERGHDQQPDED